MKELQCLCINCFDSWKHPSSLPHGKNKPAQQVTLHCLVGSVPLPPQTCAYVNCTPSLVLLSGSCQLNSDFCLLILVNRFINIAKSFLAADLISSSTVKPLSIANTNLLPRPHPAFHCLHAIRKRRESLVSFLTCDDRCNRKNGENLQN